MLELPTAVSAVADAAIDFVYSLTPLAEQTVILGKQAIERATYRQGWRFPKDTTLRPFNVKFGKPKNGRGSVLTA
jgi:hypothetical protein